MTSVTELADYSAAIDRITPILLSVVDKAKSLSSIKDHQSFVEADSFLVELKRVQKRLEDERKKYTAPLDKVKKEIMDAYRPKATMLAEAEMILKGATRKWFIAEQERKRKEEERLRAEARKKEEEERLKKAEELEKHGNRTQADAVLDTPAPIAQPKVSTSFDSGSSYGRKIWKCEVVNLMEFLQGIIDEKVSSEFISIETGKMNRVAQALKGSIRWPGVEVKEDVVMGVRR